MEYLANIKVHDPCHAGVLVELRGEFDVSCLGAFRHALNRASRFGRPAFVDIGGVTFMDALCTRELVTRSRTGANPLRLCRPSWQFRLGVAACGLEESVVVLPNEDPGYEATIAEACKCKRTERKGKVVALFSGHG